MVIVDVLVEVMVLRAYCLIKLYPETVKFSWVGIFWATQFNVLESFMLNTYSIILILKYYWKHNIKKNLCYKILSPFSMVLLYNIEGSFCQLLYLVNPRAMLLILWNNPIKNFVSLKIFQGQSQRRISKHVPCLPFMRNKCI